MNLNVLFLNNVAGNSELKKLLSAPATSHKVIFQFYYEHTDALTLNGWAKKKLLGGWEPADSVLLHDSNVNKMSLTVDIHLANVRIMKEGYDLLEAVIEKAGYQFIYFSPRIQPGPVTGISYIVYDIYGDSVYPPTLVSFTGKIPITSTKNPSPPY